MEPRSFLVHGGDIWAKCNNNQMSTAIHKQWEQRVPLWATEWISLTQPGWVYFANTGEREEHQGEGKRPRVAAEV